LADDLSSLASRVAPKEVELPKGNKTMLDHILDRVRRGKEEVTIDTEGYTRDQVEKVIAAAKARKLNAAYDGRFILIREL
jgi:NDP-sugar pyrophosphorylase family protein